MNGTIDVVFVVPILFKKPLIPIRFVELTFDIVEYLLWLRLKSDFV